VTAGVAAIDEDWLRTAPYDEARRALLAVRGVGAFTAHAILLRALGRPDDVPLEMTQFARVAEQIYGEPAPSPQELRDRYGAQIGWWAYLTRIGLGWLAESPAASGLSATNPVRPPAVSGLSGNASEASGYGREDAASEAAEPRERSERQ